MQENKEFYVVIKGKKVVVTEEVYRAYVRPIRTEQRIKAFLFFLIFLKEYSTKWIFCGL